MNARQHEILRNVEDAHWWHQVLHRLVLESLRARLRPDARVLDAGCGTGGLLARLRGFDAFGCDISPAAVELCKGRGLPQILVADVHAMPFDEASFDAVLSLDVLYHAQVDEDRTLAEMRRVLRPGGLLVLNVPAFNCLRGAHDAAVCGVRRYKREELSALLSRHGFAEENTHYWNAWLFLPLLLRRRLSRNAEGDLHALPPWLNGVLAAGGRLDARICRVLRVPFGTSVFATAQRMP
ncbi:MAG: class I SAM-dependent methyltransferase [Verrucomicrobiaceae bacterium]|nr:class I SAM-dependent methyltransferase [Verrucomicrobiaceae bacterium]